MIVRFSVSLLCALHLHLILGNRRLAQGFSEKGGEKVLGWELWFGIITF
jgi:hypothetical protein